MFGFLKKLLGLPTKEEVAAAQAPYKVEPVVLVNNKTGDVVDQAVVPQEPKLDAPVAVQAVETATPAEAPKKTRKPRAVKAAKPVKATEKPVAKKTSRKSKSQ